MYTVSEIILFSFNGEIIELSEVGLGPLTIMVLVKATEILILRQFILIRKEKFKDNVFREV